MDLIAFDSKTTKWRVALIGTVGFTLLVLWFAVSRQLGSMLAELTLPGSPEAAQAADLAVSLAPADPVARWLQSAVEINSPSPNYVELVMTSLEDAVRLSPSDYRWRIELARAYEQVDNTELAESEFRRAVDLAPTYAFPHWHLGNFYLRQDRADEAFAELRKAAENNHEYREQVFSLAWDYFDKDPAKVEELAARTPDSLARLALFLAARGKAADSLRVWDQLSETDKAANPEVAKNIAQGLLIQHFFPEALEFSRQLGLDADAQPAAVTNAGFERLIGAQSDARFDWQVNRNESKLDVSSDNSVKHGGGRSLRLSFRNYTKPDLYNIYQTIVVEPNRSYRLSFWLRTENLKSAGTPLLQVINANEDKAIGASKSFKAGTNEWQEYNVDIRTPENCNAITIRTARLACDQCPIAGTLWYDDFDLRQQ
jgi:tetratricopeptide (TPR) repeat protein